MVSAVTSSSKSLGAIDREIRKCGSWDDFVGLVKGQRTTKNKGDLFERLTQLYLQSLPEYQTKLSNVWRLSEVPSPVARRLNLPALDEGIDLIAKTTAGEFWSIQCKYRSDTDAALTTRDLSKFSNLSFTYASGVDLGVVVHTSAKPVRKRKLLGKITEIGLERWLDLSVEDWKAIHACAGGRSVKPKRRYPRPHQKAAIRDAKKHFATAKNKRGRMIMPCGSGKSLAAFWIAKALASKTVIVVVPSLALIKQSLNEWTREYLAHGVVPEWLCVCSDESVGGLGKDRFVADVYETGIPTTTKSDEIASFLKRRAKTPKIIFTTYQSCKRLAQAGKKSGKIFDLCIFDEAHKTAGDQKTPFATLLFDRNIKVRKRLFMTATERVYRGDNADVASMANPVIYGDCFHKLSFKKAIDDGIICDYQILTIAITNKQIKTLVKENRLLSARQDIGNPREAQALAAGVALMRTYRSQRVKHAISFHRSIKAAKDFRDQQDVLNTVTALRVKAHNLHVSGHLSAGQRSRLMGSFVGHKRALMTNARCLTEGVDVPSIDCVAFADPKQSVVDIVQAAGRAMRLNKKAGKERGYILLPIIVPDGTTFQEFSKTTEFKTIARVLTALSTQDERIAEEFRAVTSGRRRKGKIIKFTGVVPVGMKMDFRVFSEAITTEIWSKMAPVNRRNFRDARGFVRGLKLRNSQEWRAFSTSIHRPPDIPAAPERTYEHEGWISFTDWIGKGFKNSTREYRMFENAREWAHGLKLTKEKEWRTLFKSGAVPYDIPSHPERQYKDKGWVSWGDFLGTGTVSMSRLNRLPYEDARSFVHSQNLKSAREWNDFTKTPKFPQSIPAAPYSVYKDKGWVNWRDWLGYEKMQARKGGFLPYPEARKWARSTGLRSGNQWKALIQNLDRPSNIPSHPSEYYKDAGWVSWVDWLGAEPTPNRKKK